LKFRVFAVNFHKVRSTVREGLDVNKVEEAGSRKVLARRAVWSVLKTHAKMTEYTWIGFKNHPSISSVYVRFLIKNTSIGQVIKLESDNKQFGDRLKEAEAMARDRKRKGETTMNRVNEAKEMD